MRISYSQFNTYLSCGIKYQKRYLEQIPQLSTPVLVTGKAIHKALELNYRQKMETKKDLPVDDLKDCTADEIERGFQEELFLTDEEKSVGKQKLKAGHKDLAIKGAEVYHTNISPIVIPMGVEHEFILPLWDGHELYGFMDVIDEKNIIRDTKTTKRAPAETIIRTSQQLTIYAVAHGHLFGRLPQVILDYIILNGNTRVVSYTDTRGTQDIRVFFRRLERVIKGIQKGVFLPPSEAWQCQYCQYRNECEEKLI